jgi:hypothetical protein
MMKNGGPDGTRTRFCVFPCAAQEFIIIYFQCVTSHKCSRVRTRGQLFVQKSCPRDLIQ